MPQFEDIPVEYKTAGDQTVCVWATQNAHEILSQQLNSHGPTPAKTMLAIITRYQEEQKKLEEIFVTFSQQNALQQELSLLEVKAKAGKQAEEIETQQMLHIETMKQKAVISETLEQNAQQLAKASKQIQEFLKSLQSSTTEQLNDLYVASDNEPSVLKKLNSLLHSVKSIFSSSKTIEARINAFDNDIQKLDERRKTGKFKRTVIVKGVKPKDMHRFQEPVISEAQASQEDLVALLNTTININENLLGLQHDIKASIERDNIQLKDNSLGLEAKIALLIRLEEKQNFSKELDKNISTVKSVITSIQNGVVEKTFDQLQKSVLAASQFQQNYHQSTSQLASKRFYPKS